jgi:hypothetical protein
MYDNLEMHCLENACDKLHASLPLPYAALYTKWMLASSAQVKHSMLMPI